MAKIDKTVVVYFPGYNSDETSNTFNKIKNAFPDYDTVCMIYDNVDPAKALFSLRKQFYDLIDKYYHYDIVIIGSSLGGYWANFIGCEFKFPVILINPALEPYKTLAMFGVSKNILSKYQKSPTNLIPRSIFLGKNDLIVAPEIAYKTFNKNSKIVWLTEGHQIQDLTPVLKEIAFQVNNITS